jgi:hypothetical protein
MSSTSKIGISIAVALMLGCADARTEDVCAMKAPPASAKVKSTHAGDLITYPPSVNSTYSGCRVTWLENGQRLATVHLQAGQVTAVDMYEPDKPPKRCEFDSKGELTTGNPSQCLPRDSWVK